jgi:uncharacterized protein (DUF2336 family)
MSRANSVISDIESAMHGATDAKRGDVLRRVTDLFIAQSESIEPEQTALFDGVMGHLITHIESRAAVELSRRLATVANAPLDTIRSLARHDDLEISGPILTSSERLTDDDLIEIAKTKSNGHLAKISGRSHLKEAVTDILIDRGDSDVAHGLAVNSSARFSNIGMAKLVMRADGDDKLTESIARRADIPPRIYRQLLAQATEIVRKKLLTAASPDQQILIKQVLTEISAQVAPNEITALAKAKAQRLFESISQDTELLKIKIIEFSNLKRIAEVIAGLTVLSGVPFEQIASIFRTSNGFGLMVLCKTLAMEWQSAYAIILASQVTEQQLKELGEQYNALSITSAQRLFRFWQGRQKMAKYFQGKSPP